MIKRPLEIGIDFDSTIINTAQTIVNLYNYDNRTDYKITGSYGWDFEGILPKDEGKKALKYFEDPRFYSDKFLAIEQGAIETIKSLIRTGHRVTIVSLQSPRRRPNTVLWLEKHLPEVQVCFTNTFDKSIINGDIFIDDKPEALQSVSATNELLLCYGNYKWNDVDFISKNCLKVTSWDMIETLICSYITNDLKVLNLAELANVQGLWDVWHEL